MKKVTIKIETKQFDLKMEDEFADFLQKDLQIFSKKRFFIKDILTAYLQKSHELYLLEKKLNNFISKNKLDFTL